MIDDKKVAALLAVNWYAVVVTRERDQAPKTRQGSVYIGLEV